MQKTLNFYCINIWACIIKLFYGRNYVSYIVSQTVTVRHFHPCLIFEAILELGSSTLAGSKLCSQVLDYGDSYFSDKHSRLLRYGIYYGRKKLYISDIMKPPYQNLNVFAIFRHIRDKRLVRVGSWTVRCSSAKALHFVGSPTSTAVCVCH
jgi:hypothetical protein